MSNIRLNEDMIGNKVRCVNKIDIHHPEQGTIGTIVAYDEHDAICNYKVQWPKGSTIGNDRWWAMNKCIELVEDDATTSQKITDMTNEEIWEMLKPKMEKNGLKTYYRVTPYHNILSYDCDAVQNAIAIAYRSGYERAMKGRSFKFGEKKKKNGHWEPVDPKNLPKAGTRVRYSRPDVDHNDSYIKLYDIGKVEYKSNIFCEEFGIKLDKERRKGCDWVFFGGSEDSLDMWVEDDE